MLEEHSQNLYIARLRLTIYEFFSCSFNILQDLSAHKPKKRVDYSLNIHINTDVTTLQAMYGY